VDVLVTNTTDVAWKSAVGALSMLSEFPVADAFDLLFRDPFEFVDTDNATKARTNKLKTMSLARKQTLSSSRSSEVCTVVNFGGKPMQDWELTQKQLGRGSRRLIAL
jgi:hypothetical protein